MRRLAPWLVLFVLALIPRAVAAWQFEQHHPQANRLTIDELSYDSWGKELAESGDWLGDEVFFQEPLYPYTLGGGYALGFERVHLRQIQAFLGAISCVLVALLARRIFGPAAGWIAGGFLALERAAVAFPAYLLKPNLVLPLFGVLALLFVLQGERQRAGRNGILLSLALGSSCGLGALLRGNILIMLPLFVLAPLVRRLIHRRGSDLKYVTLHSGAVLLGILFALAPVALRNRAVGGELVLTTSGAGTNLYGGNNADNLFGTPKEFDWVRGIPEHEADDWRREAERRTGGALLPNQVSDYWLSETKTSLFERPGLHARIFWNKFRATLGAFEVPDNRHLDWDAQFVPLLRAPLLSFGLVGALMLCGCLLVFLPARLRPSSLPKYDRGMALELALLTIAYGATIVLTVTSMRIRLALLPLGLAFAGFAVVWIASAWRSRQFPSLFAGGAALLLGLLAANVPVFDEAWREQRSSVRDYNLATQYLGEEDSFDKAAELAETLRSLFPGSVRILLLGAEIDARRGMQDRARGRARGDADLEAQGEEGIRAALDTLQNLDGRPEVIARERFRLRSLAGWIQLDLGSHRSAANHFRVAREFDPDAFDLRLGMLQALLGEREANGTWASEHREEAETLLRSLREEAPEAPAVLDLNRRFERAE